MTDATTFEGKLLIAMPGMPDPRFRHAVIFLCSHGDDGAFGLAVNNPATELQFSTIVKQMDLGLDRSARDIRVHLGGPVETHRGFVLHGGDYETETGTIRVGDYGMTGSVEILGEIARGGGPRQALFALGYAGWGPGQLEAEMGDNGWLLADPAPEVIFGEDDSAKWAAALDLIGIDPRLLSGTAGRA